MQTDSGVYTHPHHCVEGIHKNHQVYTGLPKNYSAWRHLPNASWTQAGLVLCPMPWNKSLLEEAEQSQATGCVLREDAGRQWPHDAHCMTGHSQLVDLVEMPLKLHSCDIFYFKVNPLKIFSRSKNPPKKKNQKKSGLSIVSTREQKSVTSI